MGTGCSCLPCSPRPASLGSLRYDRKARSYSVAVHATTSAVRKRLPTRLRKGSRDETKSKIIYLVRHAEAEHNVEERLAQDQARQSGGQASEVEAARKVALRNTAFLDASLSRDGRAQVAKAAASFSELLRGTHYPAPEVVFASPLQRALQTASILFDGHPTVRAMEFLREKRTGLPCDERKEVSEVECEFPHICFDDVRRVDLAGPDGYVFRQELKEDNEAVAVRSARLLGFLRLEPAESIAIVTHKGFLREFNRGPLVDSLALEGLQLSTVFGNAEVRVCEMKWGADGTLTVDARSLEDATVRPPMEVKYLEVPQGRPPLRHRASLPAASIAPGAMRRRMSTEGSGASMAKTMAATASWPLTTPVAGRLPGRFVPAGGGLHVGTGVSSLEDTAEAAAAAWRAMEESLGGAPTFALVFCQCDVDRSEVVRALRPLAGACCALGGSSMRGVLARGGFGRVGILGCRGLVWRCGIGTTPEALEGSWRKASGAAVREAIQGGAPDLLMVSACPGCEEDVLDGIRDVCGDVPVFGGSPSDDSVLGNGSVGRWWHLHGSMAGWGTKANGAVVAALWLFSDADVSFLCSHCFAPTESTQSAGMITRSSGRLLSEIDYRPALQVLDEWKGGLESDLMRDMALSPLAVANHEGLRLLSTKCVAGRGQVECFGVVPLGKVRLLQLKTGDLVGAVAAVARTALNRVDFDVKGAIIDLSASSHSVLGDVQVLVDALPKELPDFFCFFSFGEQGMYNGVACHGNLMINIALLGSLRANSGLEDP